MVVIQVEGGNTRFVLLLITEKGGSEASQCKERTESHGRLAVIVVVSDRVLMVDNAGRYSW
jgi:hypothetical protein